MSISIIAHEILADRHLYTINFFHTPINVTVTSSASVVEQWLWNIIYTRPPFFPGRFVVGVAAQWNPINGNSTAEILQLCVGTECLIFQLSLADSVPSLLQYFLLGGNNIFVGICSDAMRLRASNLHVPYIINLKNHVRIWNGRRFATASLKRIVETFFGFRGVRIWRRISRSDWDNPVLSNEQVLVACIKVHVAFNIGVCVLWSSTYTNSWHV